jgi:hypothetical protein
MEINGRRILWGDAKVFDATTYGKEDAVTAGPLPKPGVWTLLSFDLATLGLKAGARISSLAVQQVGGTVMWDLCAVTGQVRPSADLLASFTAWWKAVSAGKKQSSEVPAPLVGTLMTDPAKLFETRLALKAKCRKPEPRRRLRPLLHPPNYCRPLSVKPALPKPKNARPCCDSTSPASRIR